MKPKLGQIQSWKIGDYSVDLPGRTQIWEKAAKRLWEEASLM
jgi:hypothetical protein